MDIFDESMGIEKITTYQVIDIPVKLFNRNNDKNEYRIFKIPDIGEKPRWVIVGGDGFIINKNPTKEELKSVKKWDFVHNSTETCYRCGESFDETPGHPKREKDKDGKWLGIWDCGNCCRKYKTDCRNNNLDPNSEVGFAYIIATLVKKKLGIEKDCFDSTGNFNYPKYDMIEHEDWGLIDVKGSSLLTLNDYLYHEFGIRKNKKADFFFCIGYDKYRKHVIIVYIIPNEEYISELDNIVIPYNRNSKYNKFKESEEEVKKWDDLFHTLKLDNCSILRKK